MEICQYNSRVMRNRWCKYSMIYEKNMVLRIPRPSTISAFPWLWMPEDNIMAENRRWFCEGKKIFLHLSWHHKMFHFLPMDCKRNRSYQKSKDWVRGEYQFEVYWIRFFEMIIRGHFEWHQYMEFHWLIMLPMNVEMQHTGSNYSEWYKKILLLLMLDTPLRMGGVLLFEGYFRGLPFVIFLQNSE